jgi:hypothetical protein
MAKFIVDLDVMMEKIRVIQKPLRGEYLKQGFRLLAEGGLIVWAKPYVEPQFGGQNPVKMARTKNIGTSKAAARSVNTTKLEQVVYESIQKYGEAGCIADQIVKDTGRSQGSVTPRFMPLIEKGFIFDSGKTRTGDLGRQQRVVVAKDHWRQDG